MRRLRAKALGVQLATLYRLIDRDDLPAYRIGRVLRIRRADLEAWLASRRVKEGELAHLYPNTDGEDEISPA